MKAVITCVSQEKFPSSFSKLSLLFPKTPFFTFTRENDANPMGGALRGVDAYSPMTFDGPKRPKRPQSRHKYTVSSFFDFFRS